MQKRHFLIFASVAVFFSEAACGVQAPALSPPASQKRSAYTTLQAAPPGTALSPVQKEKLRDTVRRWVGTEKNKLFPGASVLLARNGQVLFEEGFGIAQRPTLSVTASTIFDIASITKVVATTATIMHLVSEKQLRLDSTLGDLLPEFSNTDKANITVRQLLTHRSGLWEWQPTWLHKTHSKDSVFTYLAQLPRRYDIEEQRAYSDIGFILLGRIVEVTTAMELDKYAVTQLFKPLGMVDTQFLPSTSLRPRIAATSFGNPYEQQMVNTGKPYPILASSDFNLTFSGYRDYSLIGEVNDGNAWYGLEGVAGHAGLFSTTRDLAIFCQTILNGGSYGDFRLADHETTSQFLSAPYDPEQALGFWRYENGAEGVSFGHAGFTGTQLLFRPKDNLIVILLTNRQHNGLPESGHYPSTQPAWDDLLRSINSVANETQEKTM